jgi:hypothetical protein
MKKLRIGLGNSDFENLLEENCIFVDKTLLIRDIADDTNKILLFPRPRRFGKTSNLSMLRYFFEKRPDGKNKQALFHHLNIWAAGEHYQQEQGNYPVIFLSLKEVKSLNYESALAQLANIFASLYAYHAYLLNSSLLSEEDKIYFHAILGLTATADQLTDTLRRLSVWLYHFHQKKVIVLLDEYDSPIQAAYFNEYFNEIISFMRTFLGSVFKDNEYLKKGVLTGILRVSKENLFSDLNNVEVYSLLRNDYAQYFGFTQEEVNDLLDLAEIPQEREKVKEWYNGFQFGKVEIYNPWSVLCFLKQEGYYFPHWVNTAHHGLVQETLAQSDAQVKSDFELLLAGQTIRKTIDEYVILQDINQTQERLWSFLLFTGYLKVVNKTPQGDQYLCELSVPNKEISVLYHRLIRSWFPTIMPGSTYQSLLKSLVTGDVNLFQELLEETLANSLSYFDVKGKNPEAFYHALVLGLLVSLQETHQIQSNRESGYGRYDIMIIPKDKAQLGIVIEFKSVKNEEELTSGVNIALDQVQKKHYRQALESQGIHRILEMGIAFHGKQLKLGSRFDP